MTKDDKKNDNKSLQQRHGSIETGNTWATDQKSLSTSHFRETLLAKPAKPDNKPKEG